MPVHKTHMHPVSYITLGKNHEAEACWLNYLMRCNKSWQDQLALESGFSSFYHYIETWTIVERNVTLLFLSFGTQLCSTVLKSSTSMECEAWWVLWKMLPMQRPLFLVLFLKFWKCVDLADHTVVVSTEIPAARTGWAEQQHWGPCLPPSSSFAAQHTMTSFPLSHSTFSPGDFWLVIATTSCSYFSIFF